MSETTSRPADPAAPATGIPPARTEYKPDEFLANEEYRDDPAATPATDPAAPPENDPAAPPATDPAGGTEPAPPAPKPEKSADELRREQDDARYRRLYAQRYAEKARADAAEAKQRDLEDRLRRLENPNGAPNTADEIARLADERAAQIVAQREYNERFEAWDQKGREEFGEAFRPACETVGRMATEEQRAALVQIALDVDGGPRAIVALAADPEQAERVLAMPVHRMALAIAKLAAPPPSPAPAAPAAPLPAPIRPPTVGRPAPAPDPNGSMADYLRWSKAVDWENR